jgi:hypothetical protein
MGKSLRQALVVTAALLVALALPAMASAAGGVAIGTNYTGEPTEPGVAVDPSGNAYIAWVAPTTPVQIDFCKLAPGATTCHPVALPVPAGGIFLQDPPSVIVAGSNVYVFAVVDGASSDDQTGVDEWVSADAGGSFTPNPHGVASIFANQTVELPGGNIGFGEVIAGGDPEFQANSLTSPGDYSEATAPPNATITPSPTYPVGNLGGSFGSQLSGQLGVLGVFNTNSAPPAPCQTANGGLVYAYAPLTASTTLAELNGGSGDPWGHVEPIDCNTDNPAVAGGPSGLGLLETNFNVSTAELVQYRRFSPSTGFSAPINVSPGASNSDSVSQDGAGGVYATWLDGTTGVTLAYSPNGGSNWYPPVSLLGDDDGEISIGSLASAVGSSGIGWAAYAVDGVEYAQPFNKTFAIPAPVKPVSTSPPKLGGTAKAGQTLVCETGSWTGNPTFTYQWYRNGTLLAGVTGSTYKVGTIDEGSSFTCVVTAHNSAGSTSSKSGTVKVKVPFVKRCPAATGKMTGTQIGLLKLSMTRKQARFVYRRHSNRGKQYQDFFCLTPMGVRAGYATPKLLKTLPKHQRNTYKERVVWASTSDPYYSLDGVRAGESILTASKLLHTEKPFHIGKNYWYLAVKHGYTAVLKVRGIQVQELGIADNSLTRTRGDQSDLMHSFY